MTVDHEDVTDESLLQNMRDEFADVRLGAPVEDVVARGTHLRARRRRWPALGAGVGSVAAAAVVAVSLAAPGTGPRNGTHVVLDAWSVISKPGGMVSLTIRDQRESVADRARLGQVLREAGVPAVIRTSLSGGCGALAREKAMQVSRHNGSVTADIKPAELPKRAQIAVVIPSALVLRGAAGHSRTVRPQIVVLSAGTGCVPTAIHRMAKR
jgi:hypothetical protein